MRKLIVFALFPRAPCPFFWNIVPKTFWVQNHARGLSKDAYAYVHIEEATESKIDRTFHKGAVTESLMDCTADTV